MDKRTLIALLILMPILLAWPIVTKWAFHQMGYNTDTPQSSAKTEPTPTPSITTEPVAATTAQGIETTSTAPAATPAIAQGLGVMPATRPSQPATLGSAEDASQYRMAVQLAPSGASINGIILNEFKQTASKNSGPYTFQQPYPGAEAISRPLATLSINVDGKVIDLGNAEWTLEQHDTGSATYSIRIGDGSQPFLRLVKRFQLSPSSDPKTQGYELGVTQTVENLSGRELKISTTFAGPTMPPHESDRGGDRNVLAAFLVKNSVAVTHEAIESFSAGKERRTYTKDDHGNPLVWAGASSSYFNALVRPVPLGDPNTAANYVADFSAVALNPQAPGVEHQIVTSLTTTELQLPAGSTLQLPLRAFFGPRQRALLNNAYYAALPLMYNASLVLTSGPCGVCTFQWLIDILVKLLAAFHYVTRDWGLAIIGLVILVRAILHPITKRSQISMAKMSKMGPEIKRIQERYADDKDAQNRAMMEFYKEHGATPILGCLPMFLQMPIWLALWQALYTTFELRQAPFLWGYTWIHDLSKPDHLFEFSRNYHFLFWDISGFNLLPILMGLVFFVQTKLQPKPVAATPDQAQQQKMMMWMTVGLFPLMLYSGPSGLNLYIMTSTFIGVIESKIVRDHIKQREEAEKAGMVIVDAGKKFKGGTPSTVRSSKPLKPEKKGGLKGLLADLQAKAEQIRREADKKK
jgi:YidC/Oxa1 family membrane protein insertase